MNIYITLDYELFLNDITGDVDHCLITPTKELLKVLDKHKIKATFFVDMAYVYRLNQLRVQHASLQEDYEKVLLQINELAETKQKIGLHIHPQWFYSNYNGKEWQVDFDHYKLSDMPVQEACDKFFCCKEMLDCISGQEIDSFRAGGFSIQTFTCFTEMLNKCGITKDSSVTYKGKMLSKLHYFDYSSVVSPDIYSFDENIVKPVENGKITEYPISTSKMWNLKYCYNRYKYHRAHDNKNWGNGGDLPSKRGTGLIKSMIKKIKPSVGIGASIDYQAFFHLNFIYNVYKREGYETLVILGHPKNLSPLSLKYLDHFISTHETDVFKTI